MAALVQGKQHHFGGTQDTFTVTLDAASTAGNVITLTFAVLQNNARTFTPPSGFTQVLSTTQSFGVNSFEIRLITWVKASGGETSFSVVSDSNVFHQGFVVAGEWSGVDVADIVGDTDSAGAFGDTATAPSVDTTEAESIHYVPFAWFDGRPAYTLPSGYTAVAAVAGSDDEGQACYRVIATAGATGTAAASRSDANNWTIHSIVLNAGGGAPPADLTQYAYRFRNDDGDEENATWMAAEDTPVTGVPAAPFRLRIGVQGE